MAKVPALKSSSYRTGWLVDEGALEVKPVDINGMQGFEWSMEVYY